MFAAFLSLLASINSSFAEAFSPDEIARMLAREPPGQAVHATQVASDQLLEKLNGVNPDDPMWPICAFLRAELLLRMGRTQLAVDGYRRIVEFASANPYQDTWGVSSVVAFALYRWLRVQDALGGADREVFTQVSEAADSLLQTRLVRSAFRPYAILSSMPLFEEQLYYALASGAMRVGLLNKAGGYFLNYLSRLRSDDVSPEADPLYDVVLNQGISSPDRIALFRGKRLVALRKLRAASPYLDTASRSSHEQTRLEAIFLRARAAGRRLSRAEKSAIYREVNQFAANDDLAQKALLYDALQFGHDDPEYQDLLTRLVREYPDGASTEQALYWLARGARLTGRLTQSKKWYEQLRSRSKESVWLSRIAIDTSLALIWRGNSGDRAAAASILQQFTTDQPHAKNRSKALFWLARMAEEAGNVEEAKQRFDEIAKADWYGYYGLRSRMHLASGRAARKDVLIEDATLKDEIRTAYSNPGSISQQIGDRSVYHRRVQTALDNGLYRFALASEAALRKINASRRLQEFTFEELDELGFVTSIAVMMALRQDALAAADSDPSLAGRLALARMLGDIAGDWPVLLSLVHPASIRSAPRRSALISEPGYLRIAYPTVFPTLVSNAITEYPVSPAVLYAIMRQESFFYPAALSSARALGLFQFSPKTFDRIDEQWQLLERAGTPDRAAFLMDERLSIFLGARWFAELLLPAVDDQVLFGVLAHHSGQDRVSQWQEIWQGRGWLDDVEMMIESFRMHDFVSEWSEKWGEEARNFARNVVTDIAIANAIGLYSSDTGN